MMAWFLDGFNNRKLTEQFESNTNESTETKKYNSSSSKSSEDDRKMREKGSSSKKIDDMSRSILEIFGLRGSSRKIERWCTEWKAKNHTTKDCTQCNYSKAFGHEWTNFKIGICHLKEGKDLSMIAFASMEPVPASTHQPQQTTSTNGYNGRGRGRGRGGNGNVDFKINFNCYKSGKHGHFVAQCPNPEKLGAIKVKQQELVPIRPITRSSRVVIEELPTEEPAPSTLNPKAKEWEQSKSTWKEICKPKEFDEWKDQKELAAMIIENLEKKKLEVPECSETRSNNEIEDLNLQLTPIKNVESFSNLDVVEGVLDDDVVLDDLYDIGAFTYSVKEIGSPPFSKEVQFPGNILEDLHSLCGQVLDVNDGSVFLCDVVDGGDDVDVLISHWFYVFMLDDIRKEIQGKQVKSFQFFRGFQVEVEREAIHIEVHDGFLDNSYICNGGFLGSFLHVMIQSDIANQSEMNFGGLEAKMFQIKDQGAFQFNEEVNQIQYFLNGDFEVYQFFLHTDPELDFKVFYLQMLILEIMKPYVLMVASFACYLESFLYFFDAEISLIGKFLLDIWWFELTLRINVECMDVFARLQVENTEVFEDQGTELQNLVFCWKWFLYLGRFYKADYADLKVEASYVIEMYHKAAVFVNMKSIIEEVSALEKVSCSLKLPQVLKLANVFWHKLWFSRAQSMMLVGSFDSNQDAFEIVYGEGFLKLTNQEQRFMGLRFDHEVM
ncbi:hypothetical protein L7F22_026918 [Adiantum nelumboides]|nr:hypothetical protein [Adiantum nelumboides]